MENPVRVLIVEHRYANRSIAEQLLTDHDLDFRWQCVASPRELCKLAADFDPNIVLCTDDLSMSSSHALLDALRLLCSQTPDILVSSVREENVSAACSTTALFLETIREPSAGMLSRPAAGAPASRFTLESAHLRQCFSSILESSSHPAVMSDSDGWITHANTSACRQLDESCERSLGTVLGTQLSQSLRSAHWLDVARESNDVNDEHAGSIAVTPSGTTPGQEAHGLAYFDSASGFPTLIHSQELIGALSAHSLVSRTAVPLVAVKLDSARIPGDERDPASGDGAAKWVNSQLQAEVDRYGSIVRVTQDDFLIVLPDLWCPADAAVTVQRVLDSIERTCDISGPFLQIVGGDAFDPVHTDSDDLAGLPRVSSDVLYDSTTVRRGRLHLLPGADVRQLTPKSVRLEMDLGDALQRHALSVQFQPQYDLKSGRGCGVEALARWVLCTGEIVAPSVFIPLAERAGLIHDLGAWVLKSACQTAYAWCGREAQRTTLSVNVSALQIDQDFCAVVERILKQSGFPARQLELEITESALIDHTQLTIERLKEWKQLGVQIAVDDFGTGYSSLSYLSRLPVDRLKLDQSIVHRMTMDAKSVAVVRSIISLAAELGIAVIAEGVETEQQVQMLTDLGCPQVQGYLLGRPMPAIQAQVVLRKTWGNRPKPTYLATQVAVGESHAH